MSDRWLNNRVQRTTFRWRYKLLADAGVRGQQGVTLREDDLKYFSEFLREFQAETDRGAALVGAALIDDRLVRLLKAHFLECKESEDLLKGGSAPLGAFSARIKMAYCLGLITDLEYKECDYIRRIRNEFAHKVHGLTWMLHEHGAEANSSALPAP